MNVKAYLHTSLSPYLLNNDAMELIAELQKTFSAELEKKIIILINAATDHPSMSHYQLSLTHKALGDCYYEHGYFGSALEQYNRALAYNKNLPVKRRVNKMLSLPAEERKVSQSPDIVDDVMKYPEYKEIVKEDAAKHKEISDNIWADHEEEKRIHDKVIADMIKDAMLENSIIDPAHDAEIERRLDVLGEPYKSEFYRIQEKRRLTQRPNDILSLKEHDLLTLQSMENAYRNRN